MGEKTPHTVKFSKFFTSLLSYAGLLGPSILTLHILNLTLNSDIPIPPMDVSRVEIKDETIEPKFHFFPDLKDEEKEDNEGEEDDGEEGEEDEGETDEDEETSDPIEEEQQEPEEPEPEEKEENNEEPENPKEDEGSKFLNEDGKLDYDMVAAWAKSAIEFHDEEKN